MLRIAAALLWLAALALLVGGLAVDDEAVVDGAIVAGIAAGCMTLAYLIDKATATVVTVIALYHDDVPGNLRGVKDVQRIIDTWHDHVSQA